MSTLHCSAVPHTSKPRHLAKKIWSTLSGRNSKRLRISSTSVATRKNLGFHSVKYLQ
uniref:Uncharacterized protein n=1 Tax=Octopus bimaculoides TaxID=37653 RepID=A0A0L8G2N2_OCTBM